MKTLRSVDVGKQNTQISPFSSSRPIYLELSVEGGEMMSPGKPGGAAWTCSSVGTSVVGLMLMEHLVHSLPFLQAPKHLRPTENRAMFSAAIPQGVILHMHPSKQGELGANRTRPKVVHHKLGSIQVPPRHRPLGFLTGAMRETEIPRAHPSNPPGGAELGWGESGPEEVQRQLRGSTWGW